MPRRVQDRHDLGDQDSLVDLYFQARNWTKLAAATTAQLRAARGTLTDSYRSLSKSERGGVEGRAHEVAIRPILAELSRRGC